MKEKDKFITKHKETKKYLNKFKKTKFKYNSIIKTLKTLGDFNEKIEVRLFDDEENITLIALDNNNILYKIYLYNIDPLKNNNIEICNEKHDIYHVSRNEKCYSHKKVGTTIAIDKNNYIKEYNYPTHNYYEICIEGKIFFISLTNNLLDINLLKEYIIQLENVTLSNFYYIIEILLNIRNKELEEKAYKNNNISDTNYLISINSHNYTFGVKSKKKK